MSLQCDVLVISFAWNFMAERAIDTMAHPCHLLHVRKTQERIAAFRRAGWVESIGQTPAGHPTLHHDIIEGVLRRSLMPHLDREIVVFVDHDLAWHGGVFAGHLSRLMEAMSDEGVLLASFAQGAPCAFYTMPMFGVRRTALTDGTWIPWDAHRLEREKPAAWCVNMFDTGMWLASNLRREFPGAVGCLQPTAVSDLGHHISGKWCYLHSELKRHAGLPIVGRLMDEIRRALDKGGFQPSAEEIRSMAYFVGFRRWLEAHGFPTEPPSAY